MLRRLALWLLRQLEESLDPDLKVRLDEYRARKAALEAQTEEAQIAIAGLDSKLAQLSTQRAATQTELAEAERAASQIEEKRREILDGTIQKDSIRNASDSDLLHDRL